MKISKALLWIIKAVVAGGCSLIGLSIFLLCYQYSGVHIECGSKATDYTWEPNQIIVNMAEGRSVMKMDENGYNNVVPIPQTGIDVLLMGSSHLISTELDQHENIGFLLNESHPELYTYNIGMHGHTFYTNVKNLSNAVEYYHPRKYVVIEVSSVQLNTADMLSVVDGTYPSIVSHDNDLMYTLQKYFPVAKQFYKQMEAAGLLHEAREAVDGEINYESAEYRQALDRFLETAAEATEASAARLIIYYHPPLHLDKNGEMVFETDESALDSFRDCCEKHDIILVDMTEDFDALYDQEHLLPYGFTNTQVGRGHMNKYGHYLVAERLSDVISGLEEGA